MMFSQHSTCCSDFMYSICCSIGNCSWINYITRWKHESLVSKSLLASVGNLKQKCCLGHSQPNSNPHSSTTSRKVINGLFVIRHAINKNRKHIQVFKGRKISSELHISFKMAIET